MSETASKANGPTDQENLQPRRSTRKRKQVQRLEVSHAPTHQRKKSVPKWKLNKQEKCVRKHNNAVGEDIPKDTEEVGAENKGRITDVIRGRYAEDEFFKTIETNPSQFRNFILEDGLIYMKSELGHALCVPDIKEENNSVREIVIHDTHSKLGHAGYKRTKYAMRGRLWWHDMINDIKKYC
ncbi:hypothetical protein V565_329150 [Rhizoctonia solani 123E]|uniref:Integrase zinc-binding domain-containing protein n=1 Tax=Rhizoctonia solani 123E TaxID=1423351 RepID=A0A074RDY7_9AGAM|nr:hypothetical protein V565_329150 [Rhizoctonia solani 123E]